MSPALLVKSPDMVKVVMSDTAVPATVTPSTITLPSVDTTERSPVATDTVVPATVTPSTITSPFVETMERSPVALPVCASC